MFENKNKLIMNYTIILFAFIGGFLLSVLLPFDQKVSRGLALLFVVAVLWLTEAIHTTITALLVPIGAILLGLEQTKTALQAFSNPTIFLFFGGFAIATALNVQNLDRYIASKVLSLAKGNFVLSILLIFSVTALLSMGISNTATSAMMIPLAIGMLKNIDFQSNKNTYGFVILGIAYSSNIGGMGTIVGSPPNGIVASQLKMSFMEWLKYGIPMMALLMPIAIFSMYIIFKPKLNIKINMSEYKTEKLNSKQYLTIFIFLFTAACWIFSKWLNPFISNLIGIESISEFDSIVSIGAAISICISGVASWKQIQENTDWGVLMLFGGGLTLSAVLTSSGASKTMVDWIVSLVEGQHFFVIGLFVAAFIIFLTEFTSNTASAALLVPIFYSIAIALNMNPLGLTMIIGLGASCAFMLPVATPPNAIAYGTGFVQQKDMIKAGFILNVLCIIAISIVAYFFWYPPVN